MSLPEWLFETTWIYHITAIENLPGILESGCLYASNHRPNDHASIANRDIQDRRAAKAVDMPPGGVLHDYVPFYFAPRSPMLCANHRGSFEGARPQDEIVHLVTTAQRIHEQELPYVFYDQHAITALATCYNNIDDLDNIDWDLFFERPLRGGYAEYWQDRDDPRNPRWLNRKAVRQAEFLVHETLDWQNIEFIGTMNKERTSEVQAILSEFDLETPVETKRSWYF